MNIPHSCPINSAFIQLPLGRELDGVVAFEQQGPPLSLQRSTEILKFLDILETFWSIDSKMPFSVFGGC